MSKLEERNAKFYTEDGLKALKKKMINFIDLFNDYDFPFEAKMLGFGKFKIESKEECLFRIKELGHLTGVEFKSIEIKSKDTSGNEIIRQMIEVEND